MNDIKKKLIELKLALQAEIHNQCFVDTLDKIINDYILVNIDDIKKLADIKININDLPTQLLADKDNYVYNCSLCLNQKYISPVRQDDLIIDKLKDSLVQSLEHLDVLIKYKKKY